MQSQADRQEKQGGYKVKELEAEKFAEDAHSSIMQLRKYTNEPYIVHPRNVAYLVKVIGGTEDMICAAYLHDVLEDVAPNNPKFNSEVIISKFGSYIFSLVLQLTDVPKFPGANREIRKKLDREHISEAPKDAQTIKLADLIDNSLTIVKYDPGFAKVYLKEKRLLLNVLTKGDKSLWDIANNILLREGY